MDRAFIIKRISIAGGLLAVALGFFRPLQAQVVVSGAVVERAQFAPVAGATVRLSGFAPQATGASGRFRFAGLAPGTYLLSVDALGQDGRGLQQAVRRAYWSRQAR